MQKVIINGKFLTQKVTGVQRYARELIQELDKIIEPDQIELVMPKDGQCDLLLKNIEIKVIGMLEKQLWEQISFPKYVKSKHGIALNLCNVGPLFNSGIVCIHDVKIKATPQFFSKKFLLWYNVVYKFITKRANDIITVSEFSKSELIKYYDIEPQKVNVIPNAWQHFSNIEFDENALIHYGLEKNKYWFALSSLEPNKNLKWIAEIAKRNPNYVFAVAGAINNKIFNEKGIEYSDNIKFLGYVSDKQAKMLMKECRGFIFPTFYEGFGIPPLEAMCAGTKTVIVSDTEVMHEIYADSVIYIDPNRYDYKIDMLLEKDTSKEIKNVLSKYSWQKSAELLKCLIEKYIN